MIKQLNIYNEKKTLLSDSSSLSADFLLILNFWLSILGDEELESKHLIKKLNI